MEAAIAGPAVTAMWVLHEDPSQSPLPFRVTFWAQGDSGLRPMSRPEGFGGAEEPRALLGAWRTLQRVPLRESPLLELWIPCGT